MPRAGDDCGGVVLCTKRRFDEARLAGAPRKQDSQVARHATRPSQARLVGAPRENRETCHTPLVPILHERAMYEKLASFYRGNHYAPLLITDHPLKQHRMLVGVGCLGV